MIYIKISKNNINDHYFWSKFISNLQYSLANEQSLDNKILVVKLQEITIDDNAMIPKLEYKNS